MNCSRESFDLVQLKNNPPWSFSAETKVTLPGAHGSELIRSFCFFDAVSNSVYNVWQILIVLQHQIVVTCGEDGQIKAWKGE